jgi:hypothetical protein
MTTALHSGVPLMKLASRRLGQGRLIKGTRSGGKLFTKIRTRARVGAQPKARPDGSFQYTLHNCAVGSVILAKGTFNASILWSPRFVPGIIRPSLQFQLLPFGLGPHLASTPCFVPHEISEMGPEDDSGHTQTCINRGYLRRKKIGIGIHAGKTHVSR